ncbi:MAG: hypothetical protein PQJ28_03030 [Spirochaetales bacterium]|nr:hypothetical protein [Spirochaetales bacterium]
MHIEISELSLTTVKAASTASESLDKLVPGIQKTSDLIQEISAATTEQSAGVDQINSAILQLNDVIQQNVYSAEQMSGTSDTLAGYASELRDMIAFFKFDKSEKKSAPAAEKKSSAPAPRALPPSEPAKTGTAKADALKPSSPKQAPSSAEKKNDGAPPEDLDVKAPAELEAGYDIDDDFPPDSEFESF